MSHMPGFSNPTDPVATHMPAFVNASRASSSSYFGGLFPEAFTFGGLSYFGGLFPELVAGSNHPHMPAFDNGATVHPHMPGFVNP